MGSTLRIKHVILKKTMAFSVPEKNIRALSLASGMKVADFGSGSGAYVRALARVVGHEGVVYALDINEDALVSIKKELQVEGLPHVDIIWADVERVGGSRIKDQSLDAVVISDLLFQVEDPRAVVQEAYRVLRSGGQLLLIDWQDHEKGSLVHSTFSAQRGETLVQEVGFALVKNIDAGEHHWGLVATRVS